MFFPFQTSFFRQNCAPPAVRGQRRWWPGAFPLPLTVMPDTPGRVQHCRLTGTPSHALPAPPMWHCSHWTLQQPKYYLVSQDSRLHRHQCSEKQCKNLIMYVHTFRDAARWRLNCVSGTKRSPRVSFKMSDEATRSILVICSCCPTRRQVNEVLICYGFGSDWQKTMWEGGK